MALGLQRPHEVLLLLGHHLGPELVIPSSAATAAAVAGVVTAADAGAFTGPLIGAALLAVDFRLVSAVACGVFAVLTVAQILVLPPRAVDAHHDTVFGSWSSVVRNGRFVAFTFSSAWLPTAVEVQLAPGVVVLGGAVLFTFGIALANPFTMQLIPIVGSERLVGTYYGFFYLVSAIVAAGVSAVAGALIDAEDATGAALMLVAVGTAGAVGTQVLQWRGVLEVDVR